MNDTIIVDFEDRSPTRGILPSQITSIANALQDALFPGEHPLEERQSGELTLIAIHPGSLRLIFASAKTEMRNAPIASGVRIAGVVSAGSIAGFKLVTALVALGLATIAPPGKTTDLGDEVAITPPDRERYFALVAALREVDQGRCVLRMPECPAVAVIDADRIASIRERHDLEQRQTRQFVVRHNGKIADVVDRLRRNLSVETITVERSPRSTLTITLSESVSDRARAWSRLLSQARDIRPRDLISKSPIFPLRANLAPPPSGGTPGEN